MLKIVTMPVGLLGTNCYLAFKPENNTLYIIDPGADAPEIVKNARKFAAARTVILLTHAHVDHISALGAVRRELAAETVYLHEDDRELYSSPHNALEPYLPAANDLPPVSGIFNDGALQIIHTPGHTRGGVSFYFPEEKILFSGDTLFAGSVGRTDFPGGSWPQLKSSILNRLLTLPPDVTVYPGHGAPTSIKNEKSNPYVG